MAKVNKRWLKVGPKAMLKLLAMVADVDRLCAACNCIALLITPAEIPSLLSPQNKVYVGCPQCKTHKLLGNVAYFTRSGCCYISGQEASTQ